MGDGDGDALTAGRVGMTWRVGGDKGGGTVHLNEKEEGRAAPSADLFKKEERDPRLNI